MSSSESKDMPSNQKKSWKDIAEVRMLLYVLPVGTALAIIGLVLSQCSYR